MLKTRAACFFYFLFLIRKARIKRAGIINLRLESGRLISEQRGRCKKCQRTFPSPFFPPGRTLIQVHHSTVPCLSVGLVRGRRPLGPPMNQRPASPHCSLNEYLNRSPFIFNGVTGSRRTGEGDGTPLLSKSRLVSCNPAAQQAVFNERLEWVRPPHIKI